MSHQRSLQKITAIFQRFQVPRQPHLHQPPIRDRGTPVSVPMNLSPQAWRSQNQNHGGAGYHRNSRSLASRPSSDIEGQRATQGWVLVPHLCGVQSPTRGPTLPQYAPPLTLISVNVTPFHSRNFLLQTKPAIQCAQNNVYASNDDILRPFVAG